MFVSKTQWLENYSLKLQFTYFSVATKLTLHKKVTIHLRGEWPSGLYSLRQVTEVKLGRVRSDFGWVTTEA